MSIKSDIELKSPVPHGHAIGVDVGLLSYVATSDAYTEPRPKFFDHSLSSAESATKASVKEDETREKL